MDRNGKPLENNPEAFLLEIQFCDNRDENDNDNYKTICYCHCAIALPVFLKFFCLFFGNDTLLFAHNHHPFF